MSARSLVGSILTTLAFFSTLSGELSAVFPFRLDDTAQLQNAIRRTFADNQRNSVSKAWNTLEVETFFNSWSCIALKVRFWYIDSSSRRSWPSKQKYTCERAMQNACVFSRIQLYSDSWSANILTSLDGNHNFHAKKRLLKGVGEFHKTLFSRMYIFSNM